MLESTARDGNTVAPGLVVRLPHEGQMVLVILTGVLSYQDRIEVGYTISGRRHQINVSQVESVLGVLTT